MAMWYATGQYNDPRGPQHGDRVTQLRAVGYPDQRRSDQMYSDGQVPDDATLLTSTIGSTSTRTSGLDGCQISHGIGTPTFERQGREEGNGCPACTSTPCWVR